MADFPFSGAYFPPAPVVEVNLGAPGTQPAEQTYSAFVDTGADATIVPLHLLKQFGAHEVDRAVMRSQWGERRPVSLYSVALGIANQVFPALHVVGDNNGDEIVLGRNVLNRLRFEYDGPAGYLFLIES